jgi:cell division septal protein FtsQ
MDRSLAGRAALGRPLVPRVARPALRLRAPRARAAAAFVWHRCWLRIALALGCVLAGLLAGGWVWLRHSSLVAVQRVRISGVHGPDARRIDAALTDAARRMSTLDVRVGALRAAVAPFAVVREVNASASFPHGLRIRVREQPPLAALQAGGTRTAVAADGAVLGPALLSSSLPTITAATAPAPGRRLGDPAVGEVLAVLGAAPAPLAGLVARAYNGPEGVTVVMRSGLSAYFGDAGRPRAKWLALALVMASERAAGASYVDVRVPARPAAGFPGGAAPSTAPQTSSASSAAPATGAATPEATAGALEAGLSSAVGREAGESPGAQAQKASEEPSSGSAGESQAASAGGGGAGSETSSGAAQPGH